jgi:type I restriction enzyme S subunit
LRSNHIALDDDIVLPWLGCLEYVQWAGGAGALNQHLFKATSTTHPHWLCYIGIFSHLEAFRHRAAGEATTMGHIQRHHLSEAKLALPPGSHLDALSPIISPIVECIWQRQIESRPLSTLRDTLHPKLISGELRLPDAERFLAQVAA